MNAIRTRSTSDLRGSTQKKLDNFYRRSGSLTTNKFPFKTLGLLFWYTFFKSACFNRWWGNCTVHTKLWCAGGGLRPPRPPRTLRANKRRSERQYPPNNPTSPFLPISRTFTPSQKLIKNSKISLFLSPPRLRLRPSPPPEMVVAQNAPKTP